LAAAERHKVVVDLEKHVVRYSNAMKGKAIARQSFYDVYHEGDGEALRQL